MKWTYLLVDFFTVLVPFLFSFHPKIQFHKNFGAFIKANVIASMLFLTWDAIFTAKGVWSFNARYISGIYIYNLPVEEVLFFICIPMACLFTYHCFNLFFRVQWSSKVENLVIIFLSLMLFAFGIIFYQKLYTAVTFISTAIVLLLFQFLFKVIWLPRLLSVYPILLIPFFIVNGILTGTGLAQPVVLYNDAENMGIRLLTIPAEDVIYGFELILINIFLYEWFLNRRQKPSGDGELY